MLKNKIVRILLNLASDWRARHSKSNNTNDTQIWAHMQKFEKVKVQVWLVQVAGGDDMEKVSENGETPSGGLRLGLVYRISKQKEEAT